MRVLPVVAILLLAGCVSPGGDGQKDAPVADGGAGGAADATLLPWTLLDCTFFVMEVPVDGDRLRERLPEGFELDDSGGLVPVLPGAYLGIEAFECARGAGLDGEIVEPIAWASFFTNVVPPERLAREDVNFHFVMWDTLVPDAPRRERLAAHGLPVRDGTVTFERTAPVPQTRVAFTLDGVGAFIMEGVEARPGEPFGGTFIQFMEAEDGRLASWNTSYQAESVVSGRALLTMEPGSWPAQVLGAERAAGTFITGRWSFPDGTTTFPAS